MIRNVTSFRDLLAWQRAIDLTVATYDVTERLPRHERLGLSMEMRKTARSVACNIAEGQQRHTTREYLRFLDIALGSQAELETQVRIAARVEYFTREEALSMVALCEEVGRLIRGLSKALQTRSGTRSRSPRQHRDP